MPQQDQGRAPARPDPPYDVFLSYRWQEPVKSWVRQTLLPQLEAQGLRVLIDFRDFRLGVPLIKEMERSVEQSRYTLAILTPAYLMSNFTELENLMAGPPGTGKRRTAIVPYSPRALYSVGAHLLPADAGYDG